MSSKESSSLCIITIGTIQGWWEEVKYCRKKTVNTPPHDDRLVIQRDHTFFSWVFFGGEFINLLILFINTLFFYQPTPGSMTPRLRASAEGHEQGHV